MLLRCLALAVLVGATVAVPVRANKKPNLILILTDDQDKLLDSMKTMNKTQELLVSQGATFSNNFVNTPICCPSRTETMTGRYYHNVGAPTGSCMHVNAEENVFDPKRSIFARLQQAGYATGVFGKVTNDQTGYFCGKKRAEGMTTVSSPCDYNNFYSKQYFVKLANGSQTVEVLPDAPTTYQTAQIGNRSLAWIKDMAEENTPFFAYIGPHAPHYPATPAPWDETDYSSRQAPRTPNWNASGIGKHEMVAQNPPLDDNVAKYIDQHYRDRLRALVSVDDVVGQLFATLKEAGQLDNTYIFYTSDNGYHLGQFRLPTSKQQIYETDIHLPLYVRGPGIKSGVELDALVGNVDIAPTLLDLAGAQKDDMDGKSLMPHLVSGSETSAHPWRTSFLVEYLSVGSVRPFPAITHVNAVLLRSQPDLVAWANVGGVLLDSSPLTRTQGHNKAGPKSPTGAKTCKEGTGNCWFIDSTNSNSYRALRVINGTSNLLYAEFDSKWKFDETGLEFVELYDLNADPWQMDNLHNKTSAAVLHDLHEQVASYFSCSGSQCP